MGGTIAQFAVGKVSLPGHFDLPVTRVLQGDLAAPASFLSAPELHLLDFNKPTALLCVAVLHFVVDDATAISAIDTLKMKLVPGSYLAIAHGSRAKPFAHITKPLGPTYRKWVGPVKQRPSQDILRFFDGTTLVDPGLAFTPEWRPKIHDPYLPHAKLPFTQFPEQSLMLAGVGRV